MLLYEPSAKAAWVELNAKYIGSHAPITPNSELSSRALHAASTVANAYPGEDSGDAVRSMRYKLPGAFCILIVIMIAGLSACHMSAGRVFPAPEAAQAASH
jgi:hypothetical protein